MASSKNKLRTIVPEKGNASPLQRCSFQCHLRWYWRAMLDHCKSVHLGIIRWWYLVREELVAGAMLVHCKGVQVGITQWWYSACKNPHISMDSTMASIYAIVAHKTSSSPHHTHWWLARSAQQVPSSLKLLCLQKVCFVFLRKLENQRKQIFCRHTRGHRIGWQFSRPFQSPTLS